MDKATIGLTGEFYTLARLSAHGLVATLTLGNTKGVDILVTNQKLNKLYKVEVKTTHLKPRNEKMFSDDKMYIWTISSRVEKKRDDNLIYVFIALGEPDDNPKFFVVHSRDVAKYSKWQHSKYEAIRKRPSDTTMRKFRIEVSDPNRYQNNWKIFNKK